MKKPNKNLPNILSFIRLLMVPLFVWLFFSGVGLWAAGLVYLAAGATDVLDGRIARKYNYITKLGRIIDPAADKMMQIAAFACLAVAKIIPLWVVIVLAAKEVLLLLGGWLMLKQLGDVPPSNKMGKLSTLVFFIITLAVIIFDMPGVFKTALLCVGLAFSLLALVIYYVQAVDKFKKHTA